MIRHLRRVGVAVAIVAGLMNALGSAPAQAAAPAGAFFNGFEKNTNGWFDGTNGGNGILTRQPSGYANGGQYASGIDSAAGEWHARVTGDPCDRTTATNCYGPFTRWGGYSSTFPDGGYHTQIDIYLDVTWAATHQDYRFDWDSSINDSSGNFLQDYVFNAGTSPAGPPGFFVNASTNATRSGAYPENPCPNPGPCRAPAFITTSGWYTFRHTFRNEAGSLAVDFDIFPLGSSDPIAHWTILPGHPISTVGGNRYGWIVIDEIPDLPIDNSLRSGSCRKGDGGDGNANDTKGKSCEMHGSDGGNT